MENEKIFLTWKKQVDQLADRNLDFVNEQEKKKALQILQNNSYYALVNGYKDIINVECINGEDDYKGAKFCDLNQAYNFDKEVSAIIFKYLLKIEDSIKSIFSYYVGKELGHKEDDYLLDSNYKSGNYVRKADKYERDILLDKLRKITAESNAIQVQHYRNKHKYVTPWVLASAVSLDTLMYWFKLSNRNIKQSVVKLLFYKHDQWPFSHITTSEENIELFSNLMTIVKEYRNRAAHGSRVINHLSKHNLKINLIRLYANNRNDLYEKYTEGTLNRDFFSLCVTIVIMLSKRDDVRENFIFEINEKFENLAKENKELYQLIMTNTKIPTNYAELLRNIIK